MENKCMRDVLLTYVNEMEQMSRELFECLFTKMKLRQATGQIVDLDIIAEKLVAKNNQLKDAIKLAHEQEELKRKMDLLRSDLNKEEDEIKALQKSLKEAEHLLATSVYQAKQKFALIKQANERQLSSEELIKYAHKISSSHAVAAPYNWEQGDPRRPYPTDLEMRSGIIGQMELGSLQQPQQHIPRSEPSSAASNSFPWQGDIKQNLEGVPSTFSNLMSIDIKSSKDEEDVEVMSSDSSTSSSSDSQ